MTQPQIVMAYDPGAHNAQPEVTNKRLQKQGAFKDLSTVVIVPSVARKPGEIRASMVPTKAAASWRQLMTPPNQKCVWTYPMGMEIGEAYNTCIEMILAHPDLSTWRYILTIEEDNVPPADGLVKLLERAEENPEYDVIGGLYFTKGIGGQAQIWGNPNEHPINFKPQPPRMDGGLQHCCGTGMGFTLYRLALFKDKKLRKPWFKTTASRTEGMFTQDLYFAMNAFECGKKMAVDTSVKVGHYDVVNDKMW